MLDPYVTMLDIDVDQWRNAQTLLLHSARATRRIVVIHDQGVVVKCRDTTGAAVKNAPTQVADANQVAKALYEANPEVGFVMVVERDAMDTYFAKVQDMWTIEQDLDDYVRACFAALDDTAGGVVTYPGTAGHNLGLQWRLGTSHDIIESALASVGKPGGTVVLGVEDAGRLWASLVLDLGQDGKVVGITTADPAEVELGGSRPELADRLAAWQQTKAKRVDAVLVCALATIQRVLGGDSQALMAGIADGSIVKR